MENDQNQTESKISCPQCDYLFEAKDIPTEPTDMGGAEMECPKCGIGLYLHSPGWPDGEVELFSPKEKEVPLANPFVDGTDAFMASEAKRLNLGVDGEPPSNKLSDNDKGEIKFGIAVIKGKVVLNFGRAVSYIGFEAEMALELASIFTIQANKIIEARSSQPDDGNGSTNKE